MPPVSAAQSKAMFAAAAGHSTLGIPQSVGKEFVAEDATAGIAAGILYVAPDGDVLLLRRSSTETNYAGHWALPGGKGEAGETPEQTADREAHEEMKVIPESAHTMKLLDVCLTPNRMAFYTFAQIVPAKFVPDLNEEHSGFAWCPMDQLPEPMHPSVRQTLNNQLGITADMTPEDWAVLRDGFLKWIVEDDVEAGHASDGFALDRASVRSKDADGHLRVEITPISKANVCPYFGKEIPGWQSLGLEPERVYNLYRDPEELAKGAETFAGKPVLIIHKGVKADQHPREIVVGAIGDGVVFDPPYLKAPLTIWDGEAISLIESGEQRELSSSYRYVPVMSPGVGPDGQNFDGRMTEIRANHVALVEKGRAGGDVLVQDNLPAGLAATTPNSGLPAGGVKRAPAHDEEKEPTMAAKAKDRARDEGLMERIKEKVSAEDFKAIDEMLTAGKANDEDDDAKKKADDEAAEEAKKKAEDEEAEAKKKADDEDDDDGKADDESVSKEAMDAAIKTSVSSAVANERKHQADIREAERFVRPWVGDLAVAFDSAGDVYKAAIEAQGRSVKDVHPSAYRTILEMIPKPGQQRHQSPRLAMDSAKANSFAERFPETGRIGISIR